MPSTDWLRPHYLLRVDPEALLDDAKAPFWVPEPLRCSKCVVALRDCRVADEVPVGIRGFERNQRWAAQCRSSWIYSVVRPSQLLGCTVAPRRIGNAPAFQEYELLKDRWVHIDFEWGPGGSVGFELATGVETVTTGSDLDIVLYADRRMTPTEARDLLELASDLDCIDVRVETPVCGFSLKEYGTRGSSRILLRTPTGSVLGSDPWTQ